MKKFYKKLSGKLLQRLENNALRSLTQTKALIDFSSNDYLGMARNGALDQNTLDLLKKIYESMKTEFYTLGSFEFPADAIVIKGKLEAEGITVFFKDENTINSDPLISAALGGVKLQVYSSDKEKAKEIFDEVRNYATDDFGNPVVCPNCKATKSEIYYSRSTVFYKLFPFFEPRKYQCMQCNFITRPAK